MIQQAIKKEIEESISTKQLLIENGLNYIEEAAGLLIDAVNTSKKILRIVLSYINYVNINVWKKDFI